MPTLLTNLPEMPSAPLPARKKWTRDECAALETSGVVNGERLELIAGELISQEGKKRPYVNAFTLMQFWLLEAFGRQFVNAKAPIDVNPDDNRSNEPVPDLTVLNRDFTKLVSGNPQPQDLNLVVEISDTTLSFNLRVKAPLYARAGILEYWVLDVTGRRLFCHRDPADGSYSSVVIYNEHEQVAPLTAPDHLFSAAQVL